MRLNQELRRRVLAEAGLPLVWIALTIVALIPVWHQRMLPMLETPHDLAIARAWHSFHDPAYRIGDYYALRIRLLPPFLFYLAVHLMMYVTNIEVANKLFLSAYLILFPLSILALARAFRRSPWLALGGFALAFNQNWISGSSSFLMGTALMFFAIAALVHWLNEGRRWQVIWFAMSALLCYFSSLDAWFCFGLCAIALLIHYRRQWRNALLAALALLPSALLASFAFRSERFSKVTATWHDFPTLVIEFPRRVMELFPGNVDRGVFLLLALTVICFAIWKRTRLPDDAPPQRGQIGVLLFVLTAAYVLLPHEITKPMRWSVSSRLPAIIAPLILLWPAIPASPPSRFWHRLVFLPLIVCGVILPLRLAGLYQQFSRRNIVFMHMIERLPRGARALVVIRGILQLPSSEDLIQDAASSGPVYWYFSSWPMALNGGLDPYLVDERTPLVAKVTLSAPPRGEADSFDPREAPDFEYYLVRGPDDTMERQPSLKVQERYGDWVLFKRIFSMTDEP